jgi:hypothetical protein
MLRARSVQHGVRAPISIDTQLDRHQGVNRIYSRDLRQWKASILSLFRSLFSDAKSAEDAVENVVGVDGADDFAKLGERVANVGGDELFAAARRAQLK